MKKDTADPQRVALARKVCGMSKVHMQIEEEIFYPAARAAGLRTDMMDEADVEHTSATELIAKIEASGLMDQYRDAQVKVLGDIVNHPVVEEHTEMLPNCRRSKTALVASARKWWHGTSNSRPARHRPRGRAGFHASPRAFPATSAPSTVALGPRRLFTQP